MKMYCGVGGVWVYGLVKCFCLGVGAWVWVGVIRGVERESVLVGVWNVKKLFCIGVWVGCGRVSGCVDRESILVWVWVSGCRSGSGCGSD